MALSTIVNNPVLQQNPKASEAVWDYAPMTGSVISEPIRRLTIVTSVILKEISRRLERGFACPNCGNSDPKTVDVVKRTCGYLGKPTSSSDGQWPS